MFIIVFPCNVQVVSYITGHNMVVDRAKMKTFDPDIYLKRIKHSGEVQLDEEGLRLLLHHQLFSIPFENFDVLLGRPILLDPASLFDKLVSRPRGGYCFELNGLFLQALQYFGFQVRALLARVHISGSPVVGRGHQVSLVTINERKWLTDVGFGAFNMRAPIPLEIDRVNHFDTQTLRLAEVENYGTMLQVLHKDRWQDLYSFDMEYAGPGDIKFGNYYTSTHPDSIFTGNRIASLQTREGRNSINNNVLRTVTDGKEQIVELADDNRYLEILEKYFGIELDASYDMLPALIDSSEEQPFKSAP